MISGTDNRFKNLERKVGAFVLVALIGVIGVVLFIVVENDLFTPTFNVRLTAPKGTGFSQGMPIKLSGFRIGRVTSITLNDSAAVDVVLQIDKKYRKWMRKDSIARLIKEGMIGDYIIEISSGTLPDLIPDNGVIALGKSKSFDEVADEIAEKVKPVLLDIRDIISYVNREDGDVKMTLRNLHSFTGNMEKSRQKADRLLDTGAKSLESSARRFDIILAKSENRIDQAGPILVKMDNSLQTVDGRLPQMLEKIDLTLNDIESVARDLKTATAENLPQIPALMNKTEGVIDQGAGLLEGMKSVWPLSTVMSPVEQNTLIRRDSNE